MTFNLGGEACLEKGTLLPDDALRDLEGRDAICKGTIGHSGVKPGILERELLLKLRFEMDLCINLWAVGDKVVEALSSPGAS